MIDVGRLEEAIEYSKRLYELLLFKRDLWDGPVDLSFGSYKMTVSVPCCREQLLAAIAMEERMLRNTLELLGVALPAAIDVA
jgi:hypothetical protein